MAMAWKEAREIWGDMGRDRENREQPRDGHGMEGGVRPLPRPLPLPLAPALPLPLRLPLPRRAACRSAAREAAREGGREGRRKGGGEGWLREPKVLFKV